MNDTLEDGNPNMNRRFIPGKTDDRELVDLAEFLRTYYTGYTVKRDWYVVFSSEDQYIRSQEGQPKGGNYRHPDIIMFRGRHRGKVITARPDIIHELDGSIHDVHVLDTESRNSQYMNAGLPLSITTKSEIEKSIFDDAAQKITESLKCRGLI